MKKLNKAIGILMSAALVFSGCGGPAENAGTSAAADGGSASGNTASGSTEASASSSAAVKASGTEEKLTFQYFTLTMGVEWIQQIDADLKELGEKYNFEVLTGDANYDINEQLAQVDTAIGQGIDGAFLFVVDEGSATAVVDKFNEAGIPVIGETLKLQDGEGNNIAPYVELDAEAVGGECGKWVSENWESCDVDMSDMSKVGVIQNTSSKFQSDLNRNAGFVEALKEGLPEIPEANYYMADNASEASDDDSENSYNLVSAVLAAHPEIETWIVIGTADNYAMGSCRAIEAAGLEDQTILVSCGGEYAVKEWANDAGKCWRAACYYDAMDFVEKMVEGMLEICREGKDASEIYDDYRKDGEEYAAVGIVGNMVTSENYTEYVRGIQ